MSKIEVLDSKPTDSSDWNHAWSVVSQLAAARGTTLRELGRNDRSSALPDSTTDQGIVAAYAAAPAAPFPPVAPDQLARDIAEIERAAAALRRAEPTLEPRSVEAPASIELRVSHSIWPLVCVIWLIAATVVSGAVGALVLLFR